VPATCRLPAAESRARGNVLVGMTSSRGVRRVRGEGGGGRPRHAAAAASR